MKTIWKQVIHPNSFYGGHKKITLKVKRRSKLLSVQLQRKDVCVWFEVDESESDDVATLYCIGTGHGQIPEGTRYLGTVVEGDYVWHFYCETNR